MQQFKMLVVFLYIFAPSTKIVFGYNFGAPLKIIVVTQANEVTKVLSEKKITHFTHEGGNEGSVSPAWGHKFCPWKYWPLLFQPSQKFKIMNS